MTGSDTINGGGGNDFIDAGNGNNAVQWPLQAITVTQPFVAGTGTDISMSKERIMPTLSR